MRHLTVLLTLLLLMVGSHGVAQEIRVARQEGYTRLVIQVPRGASYQLRNDSKASRTVLVDITGVNSGIATSNAKPVAPIASVRNVSQGGGRHRVIIQTTGEVSIDNFEMEDPPRFVLDLYPPGKAPVVNGRLVDDMAPAEAMPKLFEPERTPAPPRRASGTPDRRPIIVLDPGHGGHHKGGFNRVDGRLIYEKDIVLPVALEVERLLKRDGRFDVRLTRRKDVFVSLQERVDMAVKWDGDLFVSFHTNAVGNPSQASRARGLEFWTWSRESSKRSAGKYLQDLENEDGTGSALSSAMPILGKMMEDALQSQATESIRLAKALETAFLKESYYRPTYRGIESARFKVLENFQMPSVLIELGFLTHPEEAKKLADPAFQKVMARRSAEGIIAYMEARAAEQQLASQRSYSRR